MKVGLPRQGCQKLAPGVYCGQTSLQRHVGEFVISLTNYIAGSTTPMHRHECAYFFFPMGGSVLDLHPRGECVINPHSLVFHPSGDPHANRSLPGSGHSTLHIEILHGNHERFGEVAGVLQRRVTYDGGKPTHLARSIYQELLIDDSSSVLAMEGLALELVAELSRCNGTTAHSRPSRWLLAVRDLLHDRFDENLSLSEIAVAAGVHRSHLARAFRRHYRCTVGDYLRQLRVKFACDQVMSTDRNLAEIAAAAGFADQSHFIRVFKQQIGMTPSEYRQRFSKCNSRSRR